MINNTYWLWDKVLSKDFCNLIINETDWTKQEEGKVSGLIGIVDKEIRASNIVWVDSMSPIGCVATSYIISANQQAGWDYDFSTTAKIQIGKYEEAGHYSWHIDTDCPNENNIQRKLSVSIQLNDPCEYEGGKLEFKNISDDNQPRMQQGSIIVFPSFLEHRVTPVTSGTRYSAVTWASGPAFR
jgi:PKHD-type hydroxylase